MKVRGVVQGVGMRPAVFRLAAEEGLAGFIRNDVSGLEIEVEGKRGSIAGFLAKLRRTAPPHARIDSIHTSKLDARGERGFHIAESGRARSVSRVHNRILAPADLAPCAACLQELGDPDARRFRHAFINCTACGPRFTLIRALPYDRSATTMALLPLCEACRAEYEDPSDRRFHAEAIACPACGPRLMLLAERRTLAKDDEALCAAARMISEGRIVAVKGAGGYLLACDAENEVAVHALRVRKRRPDRPLAILGRTVAELKRVVRLDRAGIELLESPARPILIAERRDGAQLAESVAPRLCDLGVFLPPTPLQALLAEEGPALQVMTSANLSGEPMLSADREAIDALSGIADAILLHDRAIASPADDSVARMIGGAPVFLRRARGYVPEAISLPAVRGAPPLLAVGGQAKSTVCLLAGGRAELSGHLGELGRAKSFQLFTDTLQRMIARAGVRPEAIACDLHPDYRSTIWAQETGLPLIGVQHHHAHVAACLAELGRTDAVAGVVFDGTGYGSDGTAWGGELLHVDGAQMSRLARLRPLFLAGGEAAIREPWRCALAALIDAGEDPNLLERIGASRLERTRALIERREHGALASGAGRWFDAVASLLGLVDVISYDGQAAVELEALARTGSVEPFPFELAATELDLRPTVRAIVAAMTSNGDRALIAARFHETLAHAVLEMVRTSSAHETVVLTGGCFQNRILAERARALLAGAEREVLMPRRFPPNDAGLSLGQALIAGLELARRS